MQMLKNQIRVQLSADFVESVKKTVTPHWGPLGWVTYKRTYARYLDDKQRTENWDETVKRVVEGNINLDPRLHQDELDRSGLLSKVLPRWRRLT